MRPLALFIPKARGERAFVERGCFHLLRACSDSIWCAAPAKQADVHCTGTSGGGASVGWTSCGDEHTRRTENRMNNSYVEINKLTKHFSPAHAGGNGEGKARA